jgi:hypothetical protein
VIAIIEGLKASVAAGRPARKVEPAKKRKRAVR